MNKSMFIGLGIFFTVIISLLSVSLTMNVKAQNILTANSNVNISNIIYELTLQN